MYWSSGMVFRTTIRSSMAMFSKTSGPLPLSTSTPVLSHFARFFPSVKATLTAILAAQVLTPPFSGSYRSTFLKMRTKASCNTSSAASESQMYRLTAPRK